MILVVGFPYIRERYFATFRHWPEPEQIRFLLPQQWTAKGGKVLFQPPHDSRITTTTAYFHHSQYPIIGGLLKGWMPLFPWYLWKQRHDIDLVYSCSEPTLVTTLYQGFWAKLFGKKHICFTWENIPYEKKFLGASRLVHAIILRCNLFFSDGLICGNTAGASLHQQYTKKAITVIPMNGLDPEVFKRKAVLEQPTHLSNKMVYTFIGAIGYRKGVHLILKAFPEVIQQISQAHLVIAGSGEYEKQIDTLINELGLRDHVTRLPWADEREITELLSQSDVFLYPSIPHGGWAEQFGYSMAEASLMELPVIATQSGSIADVVIHEQTGILVPPNNMQALRDAMVRLGADAALRHQLGKAGRQHIVENFSHHIIARKFYDFFSSFVNKKRPQA